MKSDRAIMDSARNEECLVRLPMICNFDSATTVLAHPNKPGKPKGGKLPAALGAYACYACHCTYDRILPIPKESHLTYDDVELAFWQGHARTFIKLIEKGLV